VSVSAAAVVALAALGAHIAPEEEETCPSPVDVSAQVTALLGGRSGRVDRLRTYVSATELEIEARLPDDPTVYRRVLPLPGTCRDRAEAAAVVVVAWLTSIEGPTPAGGSLPAPPGAATRSGIAIAPPPPQARDRGRVALGALGVGGLDGDGVWGGARIELGWTRRAIALRLGALVAAPRDVELDPGQARWWQGAASLSFALRLASAPSFALWAEAGPTAAYLAAAGRGFAENTRDDVVAWGGRAALRAQVIFGRWALLVEAGGGVLAAGPEIVATDSAGGPPRLHRLPRSTAILAVGPEWTF
jgi:hypothetical protein